MENFKIWDLKKHHMLAYKIDLESLEMSSNWNGDYMSWDQWRWQHFLGNVEVLSKFLNKLRLNTNLRKQRKTEQNKQDLFGSDLRFESYIHGLRSPPKIH